MSKNALAVVLIHEKVGLGKNGLKYNI